MYKIIFKKKARNSLKYLPKKDGARIYNAVHDLANNPFIGKKLNGEHAGQYSLRVVPYRIIYTIHKKEIEVIIVNIGHRQGVYK